MLAAGLEQDAAVPQAFAQDRQRVVGVAHQRQYADELRTALRFGHVLQGFEQFGIVGRVTLAVGVARRVDARRTAEEVHRQAGIVSQGRQAGDTCGVTRLENGVFNERQAGFFWLYLAEFANRTQLHGLAEHGLQFLEFAGVVAGQYELLEIHHSPGNTSWLKLRELLIPPVSIFRSKVTVSGCSILNWAM